LLPATNNVLHVLTTFREENESLRYTVSEQRETISNLTHLNESKDAENTELKNENSELRRIIQGLEQKIALMKGGRNSRTSSTSPSQDVGRSNSFSLRTPSCKKTGGQMGHVGHHLQMSDTPDYIIDHTPKACMCCGENIEGVPNDSYVRRQEVDIPPIHPVYTEHRSHTKTCPSCGWKNKGIFPDRIAAPIQYGPVVEATTGYLAVYQYLPYKRIVHFFKDCYGLYLSEGSIDRFLNSMSKKSALIYEKIRLLIQSSPVVGSDETGCRVNGKKHWFHVWQNRWLTFIVSFAHRSYEVIEQYFPGGFLRSFYVSDCYAAQLKTTAKAHQLCIAHLLRELLRFEKHLCSKWSTKMKEVLCSALELKREMTDGDYLNPPVKVTEIKNRVDELLAVDFSKFNEKEQALIKRLIKHRASILTFLDHKIVPPDNNASERAIRNVKVKTKVSGQFRNKDGKGADRYAKIRSVVDTNIKNGQDVYTALLCLANC
jgi:transposase